MLATKAICRARRFYYSLVNQLVMYPRSRWTCTLLLVILYFQITQKLSYDIATYLIGFYILQLVLSYFTPKGIVEEQQEQQQYDNLYQLEDNFNGSILDLAQHNQNGQQRQDTSEEGHELGHSQDKPLLRSLNQIQIWERATFAFLMGLACTYFKMLQIDVFWPLLLVYFLVLVIYTVQKILKTMEKHRYGLSDFQKQ